MYYVLKFIFTTALWGCKSAISALKLSTIIIPVLLIGKLNVGDLICWTIYKMYSAVMKIKWEDVYRAFSWFDAFVRLGSQFNLISWLNTVFRSPLNSIPHSQTNAKRTVVSNSTTSPYSCLDGRNEVQLIPTKVLLNIDLQLPNKSNLRSTNFFSQFLILPHPFLLPTLVAYTLWCKA